MRGSGSNFPCCASRRKFLDYDVHYVKASGGEYFVVALEIAVCYLICFAVFEN